jgi:hypothetical protein
LRSIGKLFQKSKLKHISAVFSIPIHIFSIFSLPSLYLVSFLLGTISLISAVNDLILPLIASYYFDGGFYVTEG